MADIGITKYRARVIKENALPSNPGNPATNPVDPVNPPASGGGTGVNQFIQLTDTPASYSGAALNYARVNAGETGLEFRTPSQVLTDIGGIGGSIASGQVAFGTGSGTIGGDSGLTFNNILKRILVTSPTYASILLSRTGSQNVAIGFETTIASRYIGFDLNSNVFGITDAVLAFGTAPFRVNPSNGNIFTSGTVAVNTTSPTDTLDVNGTTRIRTINNLGSTPTEVLVPSATGVVSKRTTSEFKSDLAIVPSDLGQEGATDGQVITWNNSLSQWEPQTPSGGGSLWTEVSGNIWRNSAVSIGTTPTPNLALKVRGLLSTTSTTNFRIENNAGSSLLTVVENGVVNITSPILRVGGSSTPISAGATFKGSSDTGDIFCIQNLSETRLFRFIGNGLTILSDNVRFQLGTTTGTRIGTATNQKLGFWNATPIVQPTTSVAEGTFVENLGGTTVNVDSTFDGYTLQQVVRALRNTGLLA